MEEARFTTMTSKKKNKGKGGLRHHPILKPTVDLLEKSTSPHNGDSWSQTKIIVDKPSQVRVHNINSGVNCTLEFASKGGDIQKIVVDNLTTKGDRVGNKSG
jgi:hypothetical protein